jgi:hypothetical protein
MPKLQDCKHRSPVSQLEEIQIVWQQRERGNWWHRTTTIAAGELLALCTEMGQDPLDLLFPVTASGAVSVTADQAARNVLTYLDEPGPAGFRVEYIGLLVAGRWRPFLCASPKRASFA